VKSIKETLKEVERLSPITIMKFAFGVRYDPQYAIMDRIGAVIDNVLRGPNTPFGPKIFPYSHSGTVEHVLVNDKTDDSLRITQRDTILQMTVETRKLEKLRILAKQFNEFVLMSLKEYTKLKSIERFGFLLRLAECRSVLSISPIEHYISKDFNKAKTLFLSFTQRLPSLEAVVKRSVDDYRNVIYSVGQLDKGDVNISIDYQEYFKPSLDVSDWKKKPFPDFVDNGLEYFKSEFENWFEKLQSKNEAA